MDHLDKKQKAQYSHTRENFLKVYDRLKNELVSDPSIDGQPSAAKDWFIEVLDYNVPGGKLNRGMAVYDAFAAIKGEDDITEAEAYLANVLGWCIEWLQAFFLVADDIMDSSITRRGQPCWYKVPKVGMIACNDYILLEACIYRMLRKNLREHPQYTKLLDLFHEVTFQTTHGQLLDVITAPVGAVDLSTYTVERYSRIVCYKTAYYSFYLPIACGMHLAGIEDEAAFELAQKICIQMGEYFQIQDDYLDCFADPEVIGKVGTDIQDNKCSWLVCTALQIANEEQRELIKGNYGRHDAAAEDTIKSLYKDLEIEKCFLEYEEESYARLKEMIEGQTLLKPAVFTTLLNKIYKRKK